MRQNRVFYAISRWAGCAGKRLVILAGPFKKRDNRSKKIQAGGYLRNRTGCVFAPPDFLTLFIICRKFVFVNSKQNLFYLPRDFCRFSTVCVKKPVTRSAVSNNPASTITRMSGSVPDARNKIRP